MCFKTWCLQPNTIFLREIKKQITSWLECASKHGAFNRSFSTWSYKFIVQGIVNKQIGKSHLHLKQKQIHKLDGT
jgi:hypothetical protein